MLLRCVLLVLAWFAMAVHAAPSQRERAIRITAELHAHGQRFEGERVTLWVADGSLAPASAREFLHLLDRGVAAVRAHLGPYVDEPVAPKRIEVYVSPDVGISHVRGDFPTMIYLPSKRVDERTAPYLHEIVHAVASWSWRHSEWLGEGLANQVAAAVVERSGGYHHSPVLPRGLEGVSGHLDTAIGRDVLRLIGAAGRRGDLDPERAAIFARVLRDRRGHAPPFYALAWSFTDFIIARDGLAGVRAIAAEPARRATRVAALKQAWLNRLAPGPTPDASTSLRPSARVMPADGARPRSR